MRIQTKYMGFNNRWTISSSYHSRRTSSVPKEDGVFRTLLCCDLRCSQNCRQRSHVFPGEPSFLPGPPRCSQIYHNHSHGTPVPVIRDLSNSKGWPECPPMVWYSPEIDASKFTLHILSDTPGGSQCLKYIVLMCYSHLPWTISKVGH